MSIRGSEYPIRKIFSDDFVFTIPLYQRPYSWTTEESEEMLQDLLRAMEGSEETIDELSPYFLGSIVLIKSDEPDAQVIDGQQRLTTLTMLLSALRSLIKSDYAEGLTSFLCEKGNIVTGTPTRYRLTLRKQDANFFKTYIQDKNGIEELKKLQELPSESQHNIRDNTLNFINKLNDLSEDQLIKLAQFMMSRCFMIVVAVSTTDLDSAYRIFSVLNSRGLNLSYSDILKAEFINSMALDQQEIYSDKWDEIASLLGSELFENLFLYLHAIFARKQMHQGMIEEFHRYVYHPGHNQNITPQQFIDNTLVLYGHALNSIVKANYQHPKLTKLLAKDINSMFKFLNQIDYGRWIPPALYYFYHKNWREADKVLHFLKDLERLVVSFIVRRVPPYRRMDRYCQLLDTIFQDKDPFATNSPLQLTAAERDETLRKLNGNIYLLPHICRYILLRLDTHLSDGAVTYDYEVVSVEHVLPQRPAIKSQWRQAFPTREIHTRYVNRLGNLVLLSRNKNSQAANYDFEEKKSKYFCTEGGISSFRLTSQVIRHKEWTPEIIKQRQVELISHLKKLWRL